MQLEKSTIHLLLSVASQKGKQHTCILVQLIYYIVLFQCSRGTIFDFTWTQTYSESFELKHAGSFTDLAHVSEKSKAWCFLGRFSTIVFMMSAETMSKILPASLRTNIWILVAWKHIVSSTCWRSWPGVQRGIFMLLILSDWCFKFFPPKMRSAEKSWFFPTICRTANVW